MMLRRGEACSMPPRPHRQSPLETLWQALLDKPGDTPADLGAKAEIRDLIAKNSKDDEILTNACMWCLPGKHGMVCPPLEFCSGWGGGNDG